MTVPSTSRRAGPYTGNGSAVTFPFSFKVFATTDIKVMVFIGDVSTTLQLGSQYTVTLNANQDVLPGGYITTIDTPLSDQHTLVIVGNLPYDQTTDLPTGGSFSALAQENTFDRLVMQIQQLAERSSRQPVMRETVNVNTFDIVFPEPSPDYLIGWDHNGAGFRNVNPEGIVTLAGFASWRSQVFNGGGNTFVLSEQPNSAKSLNVIVDGLVLTPDLDYTLSGNTILTSQNTPSGTNNVFIRWGESLPNSTVDASDASFLQSGVGAKRRSLQDRGREVVSVLDFNGVDPLGLSDSTAGIQAALNQASLLRLDLWFPAGTYIVSGTLSSGNANLMGSPSTPATIQYTGSSNLFGGIVRSFGIRFVGPGKATTAKCFSIVNGFRSLIERCIFDGWGVGVELSGSGQTVRGNWFRNCGTGVNVINYTNGDGTTTFTSEKNWYELCNNGLHFNSNNVNKPHVSCSSIDDIFQLNTGNALRATNCGFPLTIINPHFEQNCVSGGYFSVNLVNAAMALHGGYWMAGEVHSISASSFFNKYNPNGVLASSPWLLGNSNGTVSAIKFDPTLAKPLTTIPASPGTQTVQFLGGGYGVLDSARIEFQGGLGDNGFRYGSYIESVRTATLGHGVRLDLGVITRGSPNVYTALMSIDEFGNGSISNLTLKPAASVTPTNNGEVTFQLTSNTQLTFKAKGSDGVVRSGSITLA